MAADEPSLQPAKKINPAPVKARDVINFSDINGAGWTVQSVDDGNVVLTKASGDNIISLTKDRKEFDELYQQRRAGKDKTKARAGYPNLDTVLQETIPAGERSFSALSYDAKTNKYLVKTILENGSVAQKWVDAEVLHKFKSAPEGSRKELLKDMGREMGEDLTALDELRKQRKQKIEKAKKDKEDKEKREKEEEEQKAKEETERVKKAESTSGSESEEQEELAEEQKRKAQEKVAKEMAKRPSVTIETPTPREQPASRQPGKPTEPTKTEERISPAEAREARIRGGRGAVVAAEAQAVASTQDEVREVQPVRRAAPTGRLAVSKEFRETYRALQANPKYQEIVEQISYKVLQKAGAPVSRQYAGVTQEGYFTLKQPGGQLVTTTVRPSGSITGTVNTLVQQEALRQFTVQYPQESAALKIDVSLIPPPPAQGAVAFAAQQYAPGATEVRASVSDGDARSGTAVGQINQGIQQLQASISNRLASIEGFKTEIAQQQQKIAALQRDLQNATQTGSGQQAIMGIQAGISQADEALRRAQRNVLDSGHAVAALQDQLHQLEQARESVDPGTTVVPPAIAMLLPAIGTAPTSPQPFSESQAPGTRPSSGPSPRPSSGRAPSAGLVGDASAAPRVSGSMTAGGLAGTSGRGRAGSFAPALGMAGLSALPSRSDASERGLGDSSLGSGSGYEQTLGHSEGEQEGWSQQKPVFDVPRRSTEPEEEQPGGAMATPEEERQRFAEQQQAGMERQRQFLGTEGQGALGEGEGGYEEQIGETGGPMEEEGQTPTAGPVSEQGDDQDAREAALAEQLWYQQRQAMMARHQAQNTTAANARKKIVDSKKKKEQINKTKRRWDLGVKIYEFVMGFADIGADWLMDIGRYDWALIRDGLMEGDGGTLPCAPQTFFPNKNIAYEGFVAFLVHCFVCITLFLIAIIGMIVLLFPILSPLIQLGAAFSAVYSAYHAVRHAVGL